MTTAKSRSEKKRSDLPVSRKFYNDLMSRLDDILRAVFPLTADEYVRPARRMIDCYLNDNLESIPPSAIIPEVNIIFLTLKAEIDRARQRSARARHAALARKTARSGKSSVSKDIPVSEPELSAGDTESALLKTTQPDAHGCSRRKSFNLKWKPATLHHKYPARHSKIKPHPLKRG